MKATRKKKYKGRSRQRAKSHSHCASVDLVSASGKHAKPFFVLKGKVKPRLGDHRVTEDGQLWDAPEGTGWSVTESAYMTDEVWEMNSRITASGRCEASWMRITKMTTKC